MQLESIKNEFLANMSHEFKTPLNIILSTIQMVNYGVENKSINIDSTLNMKKYIKSIKQNSYDKIEVALYIKDYVCVSVKDNGIGIAKEELDIILCFL